MCKRHNWKDLQGLSVKDSSGKTALVSKLQEFVTLSSTQVPCLVQFPVTPMPAPCRPILFDLAYDGVSEYPVEELEKQVSAGTGSGLMGVLSGLWGR